MKKYIKAGLGLGLVVASASAFGFQMVAKVPSKIYYCGSTSFIIAEGSCVAGSVPVNFIPPDPQLSDAVINNLGASHPSDTVNPFVAVLYDAPNTAAILWTVTNFATPTSPGQPLIQMSPDAGVALVSSGINAKIGVSAYYVSCGTALPADLASPGVGSLITAGGVPLINSTAGLNCSTGGGIYFSLAPEGLVAGFL